MNSPVPAQIDEDELLGRDVRSESGAKKALRQLKMGVRVRVRSNAFEPPRQCNELSVNRMNFASKEDLARIGNRNAAGCGKKFWGWYTLTAKQVEEAKCTAVASPLKENPYHADILMPGDASAKDSRRKFRQFAHELALIAEFAPWGDWTEPKESEISGS